MKIESGRDLDIGGDVTEGAKRMGLTKFLKGLDLGKFWENVDTIGWVVVALGIVGAIVYLSVTEKQVPQVLTTALGVAVGQIVPKMKTQ